MYKVRVIEDLQTNTIHIAKHQKSSTARITKCNWKGYVQRIISIDKLYNEINKNTWNICQQCQYSIIREV